MTARNMLVHRCLKCGMMFCSMEQPSSYEWGKDPFFSDNALTLKAKDAIALKTLASIKNYLGADIAKINILEVGTGEGHLANLFITQGAHYTGIEPSAYFFNSAIKRYPALQGKIRNGGIENAVLPKQAFDLIVLTDVLEHVPNPVVFLKTLNNLLHPKGRIFIEIPDESNFSWMSFLRIFLRLYGGYPTHPQHISLFTPSTARHAVEGSGFRIDSLAQASLLSDTDRLIVLAKGRLMGTLKVLGPLLAPTGLLGGRLMISGQKDTA